MRDSTAALAAAPYKNRRRLTMIDFLLIGILDYKTNRHIFAECVVRP
jgi:hypothetical protein